MTRRQFHTLNAASLLLTILLVSHFFLSRNINGLGQAMESERASTSSSRQVEAVIEQLSRRIAIGSDTDPKLKSILVKYGLTVTLEIDGQKKTYP